MNAFRLRFTNMATMVTKAIVTYFSELWFSLQLVSCLFRIRTNLGVLMKSAKPVLSIYPQRKKANVIPLSLLCL